MITLKKIAQYRDFYGMNNTPYNVLTNILIENLGNRSSEIYCFVKNNPGITTRNISNKLNLQQNFVGNTLKELWDLGLIFGIPIPHKGKLHYEYYTSKP